MNQNTNKVLSIDINCDLGEYESLNDGVSDAAIMPYISSCNIACGGHAGNKQVMEQSVLMAKKHGLRLGAHPSYPDRKNFGRLAMNISNESLAESLFQQISLLKSLADKHQMTLAYVKPHGALYNQAADDLNLSKLIIQVLRSIDSNFALMGLAHSEMGRAAESENLAFIAEAFIDRRYTDKRRLQSRSEKNTVLSDDALILAQALALAKGKAIKSSHNNSLTIKADSLCFHGDAPQAAILAGKLAQHLTQNQIQIHA